MSTIATITWQKVTYPLRSPWRTAQGTLTERVCITLTITVAPAIFGHGIISPLPEFGSVTLAECEHAMSFFALSFEGMDLTSALTFISPRKRDPIIPAPVYAGIEMALLDALGKVQERSVAAILGGTDRLPRHTVALNATVTAMDPEQTVAQAQHWVAEGYQTLKLKVGAGSVAADCERVAAVRAAVGSMIELRLDANGAWDSQTALRFCQAIAPATIAYIEQPVPAQDLESMRWLVERSPVPIAADEAIIRAQDATSIIETGAASVLILKPLLLGGLRATRAIVRQAARAGIPCVITSALEPPVGILALLHLCCALPEVDLPCGLGTLALYDELSSLAILRGTLTLPESDGLGWQG